MFSAFWRKIWIKTLDKNFVRGVVGLICFAVEGFSIEGPSQARIDCNDNGDGSADVSYYPTVEGEYALHILCNNEDIPGSPYIAHIMPKTDYFPEKVSKGREFEGKNELWGGEE